MLNQTQLDHALKPFTDHQRKYIPKPDAHMLENFKLNLHPNRQPGYEIRSLNNHFHRYAVIQTDYDNSVVIYPNKNNDAKNSSNKAKSITNISFNPHGEYQPLATWLKTFNIENYNFDPHHIPIQIPTTPKNKRAIKSLETTRSNIIYGFENYEQFKNQAFNRLIQIDLCIQPSNSSTQIKELTDQNLSELSTLIKAMDASQYIFLSWGLNDDLWNHIAHHSHFEIQEFYEYLDQRAQKNEVYMYKAAHPQSNQPIHAAYYTQHKIFHQVDRNDLNAIFDKTIIPF